MGADPSGRILVAIDGEPHTDAAVRRAIELAAERRRPLIAVHVKDPFLKQFHNDIYAQGREEYLEHVDEQLDLKARVAVARFEVAIDEVGRDLDWSTLVLAGDPAAEIFAEANRAQCELLLTGRRRRTGLARLRCRDVPAKLVALGGDLPVLVVPQDERV